MDKVEIRLKNRKRMILDILERSPGGLSLSELASKVGVSTITLNSDLEGLVRDGSVIVRTLGSVKINYHKKYSEYVIKTEPSPITAIKEGNWRKYQASDSLQKRPKNAVFFSSTNTIEHEIVKSFACILIQKNGLEFVTEVINKETGERADIIILDTGKRIEIETDSKRAKRFDKTDVCVVRIDKFKNRPLELFYDLRDIIDGAIKT